MLTNKGLQPPEQSELTVFGQTYPGLSRWFRLLHGAFPRVNSYAPALTPASVAANTTAEQTFTVAGLSTKDVVFINKPSHQAGLGIVGVRVSAADTLAITFINITGGAIVPTSETYNIIAIRL